MCKKRLKSYYILILYHYNLKTKVMPFKTEVILTKLKMKKKKKKHRLNVFWLPYNNSHFTGRATTKYTYLMGLKFYIWHIYCPTTNICMLQNLYFSILRSLKSVKFSGESHAEGSSTTDSKMEIFPWLSNICRLRIYLWNVSYALRKTPHIKCIKRYKYICQSIWRGKLL